MGWATHGGVARGGPRPHPASVRAAGEKRRPSFGAFAFNVFETHPSRHRSIRREEVSCGRCRFVLTRLVPRRAPPGGRPRDAGHRRMDRRGHNPRTRREDSGSRGTAGFGRAGATALPRLGFRRRAGRIARASGAPRAARRRLRVDGCAPTRRPGWRRAPAPRESPERAGSPTPLARGVIAPPMRPSTAFFPDGAGPRRGPRPARLGAGGVGLVRPRRRHLSHPSGIRRAESRPSPPEFFPHS